MTRVCKICRVAKELTRTEFYADKKSPSGLMTVCRTCHKARMKIYMTEYHKLEKEQDNDITNTQN